MAQQTMQQHGEVVHPSQLRRAMANYSAQGVPISGYGPHPSQPGLYVIVINIPAGAPVPDWHSAPPPTPAFRLPRFDWRSLVQLACVLVIIGGLAYVGYGLATQDDAPAPAAQTAPVPEDGGWWDNLPALPDGLRLPWQDDAPAAPGEPAIEHTDAPAFVWPWQAAQNAIDGAVNAVRLAIGALLFIFIVGGLLYLLRVAR
jgi:hypothetical protein